MEHPWFCLLLLLCSTSSSLAQTVCSLSYSGSPVSQGQWDTELSLTQMVGQLEDSRAAGQVIIEFDAANIEELNFNAEAVVYIQPTLSPDKKKFTLSVGKDFPNYEEILKDQINIAKRQLQGDYPFVCSGGSIAVLHTFIDLKDTNGHLPNFVNGGEELTIPMPFPAGVAISRLFDNPLTIEDIDFSTKSITLSLDDTSNAYFSVQSVKVNDITWTAEIVTLQELRFEEQHTITVTATDVSDETPSQSSQETFTINIDTGNSAKDPPQFTSPLYQQVIKDVSVPLDLQVKLKEPDSNIVIEPKCQVDTDNGGDQVCELLQVGSPASDGSIPITWSSPDADLTNLKYILLTLSATSDSGTGYTVIHIGLPELTEPPATTATPCEPCTTTHYTTEACEPCTTTVMECPTTIIETTTPCEPCTTTAFECPTTIIETTTPCEPCTTTALECPTTLAPTTTECPVCTTTTAECPTDTTTSCEPCTTTVMECTTPPIEPCTTTIMECTTPPIEPCECTTNSPDPGTTTQCETCEPCDCGSTTTSIPGTGPNLTFDKDKYVTTIDPTQNCVLFTPTIEGGDGYTIKFSLLIDDEYLKLRIDIDKDTGIVSLGANLLPGSYAFQLKAEAVGTSSFTTAPALIGVTSTCNCESGTNVFSYALLALPLPEEQEESLIIPGNINNETCTISLSCYPPEASGYVSVNGSGDLYLEKLDREVITSFVIDMQITCNDSFGANYIVSELGYNPSITWDPNTMRVVVTVDDINDSKPKFNSERFIFGYPERNLLSRTMPSSVGAVVATDDDEGSNAEIKYSTDSKMYIIHPETGAIYVRHDVLDYDEETFTVTALDSPTEGNGQTGTATVEVKILDESHIFVTTVEDVTNEDLEKVLLDLSSSTGYSVHALSVTAAFESGENSTVNSKTLNNAAISIVTYALNDGSPVTMNEFESALSPTDSEYKVSAISALPVGYGESSGSIDNTGFIAAVSVLGALLGLFILGFACIYIFVIRPKLQSNSSGYKNQNGNPYDQPRSVTNEVTEADAPQNTGGYNAWTTYNTSNQPKSNGLNQSIQDDRKPSVTIWKQEFDEKTGKIRKPESSDHIEEDEENDYERRKSLVTFNENVECIEVDRL